MKRKHKKYNKIVKNLGKRPSNRATIEMMSTADFRDQVKLADLILTYPTSSKWNPQIAYGKEALNHIVSSNTTTMLRTLNLVIDWTTEEPEYLIALLHEIKGGCDFQ